MKTDRLSSLTLALVCTLFAVPFAEALPSADGAMQSPAAETTSVSPEVLQALDSVYLAAKQADAAGNLGGPANRSHPPTGPNGSAHATVKAGVSTGHMLAVGLGVAAGVMALNLVSGGIGAVSRVYILSSVMMGGMLGDYVYNKQYARPLPSIPTSVARRVSP